MGAPFFDLICLHLVAADPFIAISSWWNKFHQDNKQLRDTFECLPGHVNTPCVSNTGQASTHGRLQLLQQALTWYFVCGFFWVHFTSDIYHLQGKIPFKHHFDPLFPFSEYPMFADGTKDAD